MFYNLETQFQNKEYVFSPVTGFLFSKASRNLKKTRLYHNSTKYKKALQLVKNPFLVQNLESKPSIKKTKKVRIYAKLCVWFYKHFYLGLYILSHLRLNFFDNTREATDAFCMIIGNEKQRNLCLPRSVFAATTSKKFKEKGVLFIGVFFPSKQLHAWVLEEDYCGWEKDYIWINYTPVAIMI